MDSKFNVSKTILKGVANRIAKLPAHSNESKRRTKTDWKKSSISTKYPSYRSTALVSIEGWFEGKQRDDGAEGLWRIHDGLYDFSNFINIHPGGAFWLEQTKGTDITESFESHHISTMPQRMLEKFKVRDASSPRNYNLTFKPDGFYCTLRSRVREKLKELDYAPKSRNDYYHLGLLLATFALTIISVKTKYPLYEMLAALSLCWLGISAHNYFHKRDNWQMYTFNFTLLNFSNWRVSHALSHHAYPNSLHDLELSLFEPMLCWVPNKHIASKFHRFISWIIQPLVYTLIFGFSFIVRVIKSMFGKNLMYWHDIIGFTLPAVMIVTSEESLWAILRQWIFIVGLSSFIFGIIGLNAAHHDPTAHHDGDANRKDRDWGLFQMDTIIDRGEIKGSQFLVLTHFGEHALHHLFPTLDHGILPQLTPLFLETLAEFRVEMREDHLFNQIVGQNRQLLRTEPNPIAPDARLRKS